MRIIDGAGKFTRADGATHWVEQLRVPDLSVGTYSIPAGSVDDQAPHTEDEIYVGTAGRAPFPGARGPRWPEAACGRQIIARIASLGIAVQLGRRRRTRLRPAP